MIRAAESCGVLDQGPVRGNIVPLNRHSPALCEPVGHDRGDPPMPDPLLNIADIDERIAIVKDNLRELVEQSASYSGAADEDLMSRRIAEQEAELELLRKRRDELSRARP
jgi:hypothetical protein